MISHAPSLFSGLHVAGDFPFSGPVRFTFGGPIHNLWPLFVLPALAGWASDRAASRLPRTPASAAPALALSAAPGLLSICLIINSCLAAGPFETWRGFLVSRVTPAVALVWAGWALSRAARRQVTVAQLFRVSRPAGARLRAAAKGLRVRELPTQAPECFVAGLLRPTAFVSAGALDRLDDEELAAALAHERAHAQGGDTWMLALLAALEHLVPFTRGEAAARFLAAREARADAAAARQAGSLPLASALMALSRPGPLVASILPMAVGEGLAQRMEALLGPRETVPAKIPLSVWAPLTFLAWPIVQRALLSMFCG